MQIKFVIESANGGGFPLAALTKAGSSFEKLLTGIAAVPNHSRESPAVYLSDYSPAAVCFTAKLGDPDAMRAVADGMKRCFQSLESGDYEAIPAAVRKELGELGKLSQNGKGEQFGKMAIELQNGQSRQKILNIDHTFPKIKRLRKKEVVCESSVVGWADQINLHKKKGMMKIYPYVSEKMPVDVYFSEKFKSRVIKSLGKTVKILGEGRHWLDRPLPYRMEMSDITVLPEIDEGKVWRNMYGAFPDITGGLSVDEYMAIIRDREA